MYILGFSGPPYCGKDTIATQIQSLLHETIDVDIMHLAEPMREMGMNLLGLSPELNIAYADAKKKPQPLFYTQEGTHDNLRQFMIWMSEQCIKPKYGKDFWARKLSFDYGEWDNGLLLVPDFGFNEEIEFFEGEIGFDNVATVQLYRSGTDFSNDSRSYVGGFNAVPVPNNSTPQACAEQIIWWLKDHCDWTL
jgi:hypothetical protein